MAFPLPDLGAIMKPFRRSLYAPHLILQFFCHSMLVFTRITIPGRRSILVPCSRGLHLAKGSLNAGVASWNPILIFGDIPSYNSSFYQSRARGYTLDVDTIFSRVKDDVLAVSRFRCRPRPGSALRTMMHAIKQAQGNGMLIYAMYYIYVYVMYCTSTYMYIQVGTG